MKNLDKLCKTLEALGDPKNSLEFYLSLRREYYQNPELFSVTEVTEMETQIRKDLKQTKGE